MSLSDQTDINLNTFVSLSVSYLSVLMPVVQFLGSIRATWSHQIENNKVRVGPRREEADGSSTGLSHRRSGIVSHVKPKANTELF